MAEGRPRGAVEKVPNLGSISGVSPSGRLILLRPGVEVWKKIFLFFEATNTQDTPSTQHSTVVQHSSLYKMSNGVSLRPWYSKKSEDASYARMMAQVRKKGPYHRTKGYGYSSKRPRNNYRSGGFDNLEQKFVDYSYGQTAIATANAGAEADPVTALSLNAVAQGTTQNQRVGKRIKMKSIMVRGTVMLVSQANLTVLPNGYTAVVALVMDKQTNGAQLNSEDVYAAATHVEHAFRDLEHSHRFKVLKRQVFQMNCPNVSYDGTNMELGGNNIGFEWYVELNNIQTYFDTIGATIADIVDKSLHVVAFASDGNGQLKYESRLRYVD